MKPILSHYLRKGLKVRRQSISGVSAGERHVEYHDSVAPNFTQQHTQC